MASHSICDPEVEVTQLQKTFWHMDMDSSAMLHVCLLAWPFQSLSRKERPPAAVFQWPHGTNQGIEGPQV